MHSDSSSGKNLWPYLRVASGRVATKRGTTVQQKIQLIQFLKRLMIERVCVVSGMMQSSVWNTKNEEGQSKVV